METSCKYFDVCPLRRFEKDGKIDSSWRETYCLHKFLECKRFQQGEKGIPHSDVMLPDGTVLKTTD
jgi:hypothetical protein